ncbi:MAG: lysophospholipid acyltransferase family protein [Deltaproteobacteria bacterium]|nr:lysophospholipid acyltransferase family protein [Deltaproteobacteria bacterium]MBW2284433.1 lysophospholipid acyltransferase family protein [Deltaproteobacteria bacterium]
MSNTDQKMTNPQPPGRRLVLALGSWILRLWFSTCRIEIINKHLHDRYVVSQRGLVGACWHRNAIFMVWFFRKLRPVVMFSRSRDGDLLATFAEKLGVIPVRGSSSRGGREALRSMIAQLRRPGAAKAAATVLDGPRGPRCVAKPGMILLAKKAELPLLPVMVSAHPALTLKKTWDRTMIPLPFSRVLISYREPWHIPGRLDKNGLERLRQEVEETLNEMMAELDARTGYGGKANIEYRTRNFE